ncbi:hypothetical protein HDU78_003576 [Chytriomyces hyalinus]|nr:hypothetical protein HDU78_003576 [Chytriomyces hyalinus]
MASSGEQFPMGSVQSVVVLSVTGTLCIGVIVFIAVRIRALVLEAKGEKVPKWVDQPSLARVQPQQDSEIPTADSAYMSRKMSGPGGVADTRVMNTDSAPSPQREAHPLHVAAPEPAMPSTYFPPHAQYPHPLQQQHQQAFTSDASKNVSLVGTVNTIYSHSSKRQSTLVNVVYSHEPEKPILPTANTNNFFWMPSFAQKATTSTKHAFYTSSTTPKDAPLHSKKSRSNSLSSSFCESRSSIGGLDDAEVKEWPSSPPLDSYINNQQNLVQKTTHHADGGTAAKTLVDAFQTSSANRPKKPSFMEYFGFLAGKESVASSDSENGVLTTEDSEDLKFSSGPIIPTTHTTPSTTTTTPTTAPITPVIALPTFATLPLPPSLKTETTMRKSHSMSTEAAYQNRRTEILRRKQVSASVKDSSSWNAATLAILGQQQQQQQQQHGTIGTDEWSDALSDNEISLSSDSARKAVGIAAMRSDDSLGKYLY